MPFEFIRDAIVVQAKANGKGPFSAMLDTGVDPSVIDLETARKIGLKRDPQGHEASGGGTQVNLTYETELPLLALGDLTATKVKALAANLSSVSEGLGRPIQAVLGYSLLRNRIVQIDYPKRVVRFYSILR